MKLIYKIIVFQVIALMSSYNYSMEVSLDDNLSNMDIMPEEIKLKVLQSLSGVTDLSQMIKELVNASKINKAFNRIVQDPIFLKEISDNYLKNNQFPKILEDLKNLFQKDRFVTTEYGILVDLMDKLANLSKKSGIGSQIIKNFGILKNNDFLKFVGEKLLESIKRQQKNVFGGMDTRVLETIAGEALLKNNLPLLKTFILSDPTLAKNLPVSDRGRYKTLLKYAQDHKKADFVEFLSSVLSNLE